MLIKFLRGVGRKGWEQVAIERFLRVAGRTGGGGGRGDKKPSGNLKNAPVPGFSLRPVLHFAHMNSVRCEVAGWLLRYPAPDIILQYTTLPWHSRQVEGKM